MWQVLTSGQSQAVQSGMSGSRNAHWRATTVGSPDVTCMALMRSGPAYRYHGCYGENNGPFQGNTRSLPQAHGGTGIGIDECAAAARIKGFPVFALQWYGQCFLGSIADVARIQSQKLSDESCASLPCPTTAGNCPGNINKIYFLIGAHTHCNLFPNEASLSRDCCLPGHSLVSVICTCEHSHP